MDGNHNTNWTIFGGSKGGEIMNYLQRTVWFIHGAAFVSSINYMSNLPENSFKYLMPGMIFYFYWSLTMIFGSIDFVGFLSKHGDRLWKEEQTILKENEKKP